MAYLSCLPARCCFHGKNGQARRFSSHSSSTLGRHSKTNNSSWCEPIASSASFCTTSKCLTSQPPTLVNEFTFRSHNCGQLRASDEGRSVTVCGWVQFQRGGKFITLRDSYGVIQLIVPDSPDCNLDPEDYRKMPLETVLMARGVVRRRPEDQVNKKMATGEIEIELTTIKILGGCKSKLPYQIRDFQKVNETLRLKYRYLDLRNRELQHNLRLRSNLTMKMREFFHKHSFVEVETPTLFKKTPGVRWLTLNWHSPFFPHLLFVLSIHPFI